MQQESGHVLLITFMMFYLSNLHELQFSYQEKKDETLVQLSTNVNGMKNCYCVVEKASKIL